MKHWPLTLVPMLTIRAVQTECAAPQNGAPRPNRNQQWWFWHLFHLCWICQDTYTVRLLSLLFAMAFLRQHIHSSEMRTLAHTRTSWCYSLWIVFLSSRICVIQMNLVFLISLPITTSILMWEVGLAANVIDLALTVPLSNPLLSAHMSSSELNCRRCGATAIFFYNKAAHLTTPVAKKKKKRVVTVTKHFLKSVNVDKGLTWMGCTHTTFTHTHTHTHTLARGTWVQRARGELHEKRNILSGFQNFVQNLACVFLCSHRNTVFTYLLCPLVSIWLFFQWW